MAKDKTKDEIDMSNIKFITYKKAQIFKYDCVGCGKIFYKTERHYRDHKYCTLECSRKNRTGHTYNKNKKEEKKKHILSHWHSCADHHATNPRGGANRKHKKVGLRKLLSNLIK